MSKEFLSFNEPSRHQQAGITPVTDGFFLPHKKKAKLQKKAPLFLLGAGAGSKVFLQNWIFLFSFVISIFHFRDWVVIKRLSWWHWFVMFWDAKSSEISWLSKTSFWSSDYDLYLWWIVLELRLTSLFYSAVTVIYIRF